MTEFEKALQGEISPALREVADEENINPEKLRELVAANAEGVVGARSNAFLKVACPGPKPGASSMYMGRSRCLLGPSLGR